MVMLPAFPSPFVEAVISIFSDIVRLFVSMLMLPALPVLVVSTEIFPSPLYVGPGPKGVGYKVMFKLGASLAKAKTLAGDNVLDVTVTERG